VSGRRHLAKLTDTQLVILTAAARREDGAVLPLPRRIKLETEAASGLFKTLIKRKTGGRAPG
jgi:hypothetical protein